MIKPTPRKKLRRKRHLRVRRKVFGTPERPRMVVFKSNKHIYVQIIDDTKGHTLAAASTLDKELNLEKTWNIDAAKEVGKLVAKRAKEKGIAKVAFDRGGFKYHGKVKALADAAREAGLEF
ncbi:50S ribosomal protein L18 [Marinitoga sp. 1135]|uniref:Large ribosomal subunit protein uL18 n=1 Tax=Marinitoga piezophila (strain DSM 14283 / JCM 11233 / KA3) TaxID=443254 RepID=H2J788_MARPK|nr:MULTISPECIES: 50S ribosomal protein L18 [Marinitoga]AEX85280.1 ribosomal protein L18, bacterial type [Marinitoga piezophila KA3]APT75765.1 50S ribosomal protein L18 [Marinitoga sp. 1137]NUU95506.1 50S ribosomal protein L18 [Marinitoga sp. 1135]NUU97433.1 50S ribosomal protein L18 [Marinitoga sp. 1138]